MKKRIFSLALVLCFVLTFAAMASAAAIEVFRSWESSYAYDDDFPVGKATKEYLDTVKFTYASTSGTPTQTSTALYVGDTSTEVAKIIEDEKTELTLNGTLKATLEDFSETNGKTGKNLKTAYGTAVTLSGIPEEAGTYSFRLVSDADETTKLDITITVEEYKASTAAPTFSTTANPSGTHGEAFSFTIEAKNNVDPDSDTGRTLISIVDDEDDTNTVLSASELESTYGITFENDEETGALILTADALLSPTPANIQFTVQVSNDFTYFVTYENEKGQAAAAKQGITADYSVEKTYTLKIDAIKPEIVKISTDNFVLSSTGKDLGTYPVSEDMGSIYFITNYTSAPSEGNDILHISSVPDGLTFALDDDLTDTSGDKDADGVLIQKYYYKLSGTPTPAAIKAHTLAVTPRNETYSSTGSARSGLKLTVLDAPSISSPAAGKELASITYGKTGYSQALTLKGGDNTYKPYVSEDTLPDFLTIDSKNKITGHFTSVDIEALMTALDTDEDAFGDAASVDLEIAFTLSCDIFSDPVVEKRTIKFITVKPVFTTTQKNIQTEIDKANIKANTALSGIELIAAAPGEITWSYDKLPDGLSLGNNLTPDKEDDLISSVVTLSGTPTEPVKNFQSKITAKNGAGSTTITLKFNVSAPTPEIQYQYWDGSEYQNNSGNPISGDMKVGDVINVRVYNKATGAGKTKFTQSNLPKGLTLKADPDDDTAALITGTLTTATKSTTVLTITAQDEASTAKPTATSTSSYNVYALPKFNTKTLKDFTAGKPDISTITADGATTWYISESTAKSKPDTAITGTVTSNLPGLITSAEVSTNSKGVVELKILRETDEIEDDQTIIVWAENKAGVVSQDFTYKVKGEKVKITTSKLKTFDSKTEDEDTVTFSGTQPIESIAYIAANDAKAAGFNNGEMIELGDNAEKVTGYELTYSAGTIGKGANTPVHKGIKITVSADNGLGEAKKVFTLAIEGEEPAWYSGDVEVTNYTLGNGDKGKQAEEKTLLTYNVAEDKDEIITLLASGDSPLEVTYGTLPSGISVDIDDSSVPIEVKIFYKAPQTTPKPGAKKVTFTVNNTASKKKAKVNVQLTALQAPNISNGDKLTKEIEVGRKLSLKVNLNPADKTAVWSIESADLPFDSSELTSADLKSIFDITIDSKGTITGTPKNVTSKDTGGADYMNIYVKVSNDVGTDTAVAKVKIKGSKPKLESKSKVFTFTRNIDVDDEESPVMSEDLRTIKAQGIESTDIKMVLEAAEAAKLPTGLSIQNNGLITGKPTKGTKGQTVKISADHFGAKAYLSVKFIVEDQVSDLVPYDGETELASDDVIELAGSVNKKNKVVADVEKIITIKLDPEATETPTWKISKNPSSQFKVSITAKDEKQATVKITLKRNTTVQTSGDADYKPVETSFKVSATNKSNKKTSTTEEILLKATFTGETTSESEKESQNSDVKEANKKEDELVEEELTKELGEGDLSVGAERTESALTDEQKAAIKAEGYMIAAILPEISATVDGQYGLEVDLLADVPTGSELKWLAYPQAPDQPSEDDEIADFFDIDGADTTTVPADHIVLVYPWLREGVKYAPVIVAKVSEAAPGDVVSEEGLDEAVENAKDGTESTEEIVLDEEGKTTEAPAENAEENQETTNTETPAEKAANDESKPEETSTEAQSE